MSSPEDVPDEEKYLDDEEVAANLREYLDVLEVERQAIEAAADRLDAGTLGAEDMVEMLPDPMPLEAWQRDQFDPAADYSLEGVDGGE